MDFRPDGRHRPRPALGPRHRGSGEDPYLGSHIARARVRGFQGDDLSAPNTILACAKHFAGYGASEGGRDYNTVDISDQRLRELYLPPFKAAADAGAATFMNSFNELSGVPATGNRFLVKQILRNEWGWDGVIVSDWGSVAEMIPHGIAEDKKQAALLAVKNECDIDMEGNCYPSSLEELVKEGKVSEKEIDRSVRRILRLKYELGLFDDPYRYCDEQREKEVTLSAGAPRSGARHGPQVDRAAGKPQVGVAPRQAPLHRRRRTAGRQSGGHAGRMEGQRRSEGGRDDPSGYRKDRRGRHTRHPMPRAAT